MDIFVKRLQLLLDENNINQKELAKKVGVTEVTISRYMTGERKPRIDIANKMAEVLGATTDYLMGTSDIRNLYDRKAVEEKYPDVNDIEEAMKIILAQPGLMLKGELLSDESKIILANAIQMGLRTAEELEKKKKNKGDVND